MKLLYWAWGAILTDLGLFVSTLPFEKTAAVFLSVVLLHATCCAVLAVAIWMLLPLRYRQPRLAILLLLFLFAFMAPVMGAVGVLLIAQTTLRRDGPQAMVAIPQSLVLPKYDVRSEQSMRVGQGAVRVRLGTQVPEKVRLKSLLTLETIPGRVANPILEELLGDETDDVRLLAFGLLDGEEKSLSEHIRVERAALERLTEREARYECLCRLAELHWELVYTSLARGELRRFMLGEARRYVEEALACAVRQEAALHFLRGRILMALGEYGEAGISIREAVAHGLSEVSALPYLAEIAFRGRHFVQVYDIMKRLAELELFGRTQAVVHLWTQRAEVGQASHLSSRAQAIVDLWTGRDRASNYTDYRAIHHL
jgi:hypothetical protein